MFQLSRPCYLHLAPCRLELCSGCESSVTGLAATATIIYSSYKDGAVATFSIQRLAALL